MKDFFKKANELQPLIYHRAMEFYEANDGRQELYSRGFDFDGETVTVAYGVENEPYYCEYVTLSIEQLEMSNEEWSEYITKVNEERELKEKQKEEERLRLKLEKDQREYERLKRQFENKEGV